MKLSLKTPNKPTKRRGIVLGVMFAVTLLGAVGLLFVNNITRAGIAPDSRFEKIMPDPNTATQQRDAHLEISSTGEGNTLDAKETWGKFYFDPSKVSDATVGISKGGYGGTVDTLGTSKGSGEIKFAGQENAVKYEFYLAIDRPDPTGTFSEEIPCRLPGQRNPTPSMVAESAGMSVTNWHKIEVSRFVNNARCDGKRWGVTKKSGKYVLFVKASWATDPPVVNGKVQGRVNAFKLGAAYTTKPGNPLTGYWADAQWAYTNERPTTATYAVQDRNSERDTRGDYTFTFAPDCRLAPGDEEARYLHWSDVDYPDYYVGLPSPSFDLMEIPPSGGSGRSVLHVGPEDNLFNGTQRQNIHKAIKYDHFKGGYTYKWIWRNIVKQDGINFWLPYDDFPALNGGCGTYKQDISLQGTRGAGWSSTNFVAAGGDTLRFLIKENYTGGNSAVPTTTTRATLTPDRGVSFDGTFENSPAINISDDGKPEGSRVKTIWKLPGMGPGAPYVRQRSLYYSYKIKENAQDGARHCFRANVEPVSNSRTTPPLDSNPICVTIDNSLKPYVSTTGADVHAGDCTVKVDGRFTGLDGKITGPPTLGGTAGSSGSYIVSAGDAITNFGSGGTPGGGALTFGKGGKYGSICRPTLSDMETNFRNDTATEITNPTGPTYMTPNGNFDLNKLPEGGRYKVKVNGDIRITGVSRATVTIYAANGNVSLTNDPRGATVGADTGFAAPRAKLPVVGIVAKTIAIGRYVTTVNATMYATDSFNTCSTANWVNDCKSTLTIKGFAMAHSFLFRRVSNSTNGLRVGEQIDFNAAFYLNPPPGFGLPANQIKYLGEKAPLF